MFEDHRSTVAPQFPQRQCKLCVIRLVVQVVIYRIIEYPKVNAEKNFACMETQKWLSCESFQ